MGNRDIHITNEFKTNIIIPESAVIDDLKKQLDDMNRQLKEANEKIESLTERLKSLTEELDRKRSKR